MHFRQFPHANSPPPIHHRHICALRDGARGSLEHRSPARADRPRTRAPHYKPCAVRPGLLVELSVPGLRTFDVAIPSESTVDEV